MAENEEDYLDGLLKSLSEDENAQSENKDEEEEQIKEQVREAFEKSNEKSTKFENIYDDEDGNLNDDNIEDLLKDVMTVPRHMAASVVGVHGNAGQCNYSASKAGMIGLAKSIAQELAELGVPFGARSPPYAQ